MIAPPHDSRQNLRVEPSHRLGDAIQLRRPIDVVAANRFAPVAAESHMVDRAGEFDAKVAGYGGSGLGFMVASGKT